MKFFNNPYILIPLGLLASCVLIVLLKRYRKAEKQYDDDFKGWI